MDHDNQLTRRSFLKSTAVTAAAGAAAASLPYFAAAQGNKRVIKTALIGCGGRGSGAIRDHLVAAQYLNEKHDLGLEVQVVATADWSRDKAVGTGKQLDVPEERCFGGPDAYKRVLEVDPDVVLMATPPVFRPLHFESCIKAGKHVFFEKPVAVDPPGVRRVIAAGELAKQSNLSAVCGTQRRHEEWRNQLAREIRDGAHGRVMGGRVAWNMGKIFGNTPINPKGPDDLVGSGKWQLWVEMSGDHICEQHVHNLDIANWVLGAQAGVDEAEPAHACTHPLSAGGFGHRARRVAGNMYDFFSVDLEYANGIHIHSMCRQVGGCWDWVGEEFTFEKSKPNDFQPQSPDVYAEVGYHRGATVCEHVHLLYGILKEKPINHARNVAWATGAAIMGREAAYSGQRISWQDMFEKPNEKDKRNWYNLQCKPTAEDFETGDVAMLKDGDIRIPGEA